MDPAVARHSLDVVAGPARGSRIALSTAPFTIGRDERGDGRLHGDPELSRRHAQIRELPGHGLLVEDLGSRNGTFVNGRRIPAPTVLRPGDEVEVGGTVLRVARDDRVPNAGAQAAAPPAQDPQPAGQTQSEAAPERRAALRVVAGWAPGAIIPVGDGPVVLGRTAEGAAALEGDPAVADEHARLSPLADGRLLLEDLGSAAGTLVNGHPIPAPTVLGPGQRFQLGGSTFEVVSAAAAVHKPFVGAAPALGGVQRLPADLFRLVGMRAPVQREDVVRTFFLALGWGLGANLLVRTLAIEVADVRDDIPALRLTSVLLTALVPVSANALGFYKIFRRPDHRSVKRYLAPTFGMPIIFLVVNLLRLEDYGVEEIVTTVAVTVVPIAICAALMLRLRARVARERVTALRPGGVAR